MAQTKADLLKEMEKMKCYIQLLEREMGDRDRRIIELEDDIENKYRLTPLYSLKESHIAKLKLENDTKTRRIRNLERKVANIDEFRDEIEKLQAEIKAKDEVIAAQSQTIEELQSKTVYPAPSISEIKDAKRGRPQVFPEQTRNQIRQLHEAGHSMRSIAAATGVSLAGVHKIIHNK